MTGFHRIRTLVLLQLLLVLPACLVPAGAQAAGTPGSLDLVSLAARYKMDASWDPLTRSGVLQWREHSFRFAAGLPYLVADWKRLYRVVPPQETQAGLAFDPSIAGALETALADLAAGNKERYRVSAILIDPGHGGKDTGAIGEHGSLRLAEKEVTLRSALRVHELLGQRYPGRSITLTRADDRYPTLEDRVEMANRVKLGPNEAIIYVSIHANASFNRDAKGYEVWYLNPEYRRTVVDAQTVRDKGKEIAPILNAMLEEEFTTESIILARKVMDRLGAAIGAQTISRGIRAEEWFVVRNAKMPSILIEIGFVTNPAEAALLADESYLRRASDAIYNGIVDFIDHFEGTP